MTKNGGDLMEIKQFNVISTLQRKELYNFIKSTDLTYNKTYVEMIKVYESDTFNDGSSIFILFHKGQIKGSMAAITKEISIKGEAFITDIYVRKENILNEDVYLNTEMILQFLIEKVAEYCNICNARSVKIGIRESEAHLIPYINKLEFTHIYDAVVMRYKEEKNMVLKLEKDIELLPLSILNSHEYMNIQNEAFENSPNGGTIDEMEVKDYIVQYANNEDLIGMCLYEKKPCGVYELSIDENIGWIDTIGIAPKYQGKGLGKALLVKCIKKLYEKNSEEVKLLVITSNDIAVTIYKEFGFQEEKVFSYWFEKKLA
jgi:ribosomal protein S18 acetylase RimI-like enzyme